MVKTASFLRNSVASAGLAIAPEKIQHSEPWKYLDYILFNRTIQPQVLQINPSKDLTLNHLQQLLGAINWVRPSLGIPTEQLTNLLNALKGKPDLNSPRKLSSEALQELDTINKHIEHRQLTRINSVSCLAFPFPNLRHHNRSYWTAVTPLSYDRVAFSVSSTTMHYYYLYNCVVPSYYKRA